MKCTNCYDAPAATRLGLSICVICAGILPKPEAASKPIPKTGKSKR